MRTTDSPVLGLTFGDFVKTARLAKHMTQHEVATLAKIDQAYLSKIELGRREPTLSVALRICDALGLEINDYAKTVI